jgi:predicted RNase H-like nuclease
MSQACHAPTPLLNQVETIDEERCRLNRAACGKALSKQASAILALDDVIDAAVCLLTAQRLHQGKAIVLGGELDSRGLRMEMVA